MGTNVVPGTSAEGTGTPLEPKTHGGPTSTGLTMGHLSMPQPPAPMPSAPSLPAPSLPAPANHFSSPPATTHDPRSAMAKTLGGESATREVNLPSRDPEPTPLPPVASLGEAGLERAATGRKSVPPLADPIPGVLGPDDAPLALARAIASRLTGTLCFESKEGVRRAVLREGDLVTCAPASTTRASWRTVARGDLLAIA